MPEITAQARYSDRIRIARAATFIILQRYDTIYDGYGCAWHSRSHWKLFYDKFTTIYNNLQ